MAEKCLNKVQLLGRVGKDPEIRFTGSGKAVATFNLATSESWKGQDGEDKERTEWHRIVIWGRLAEICKEYVQKGSKLYLEGKVQTREWEDRDGNKRTTTEIVAHEMIMLGGGEKKEGSGSSGGNKRSDPPPPEDNIPF